MGSTVIVLMSVVGEVVSKRIVKRLLLLDRDSKGKIGLCKSFAYIGEIEKSACWRAVIR